MNDKTTKNIEEPTEEGVVLTAEEIAQSDEKKRSKPKTTAQLPIARAAADLQYVLLCIVMNCPRSLRAYTDGTIRDVKEIMRQISMANSYRGAEREFYITCGLALTDVVKNDFSMLHRLNIISKDEKNKCIDKAKSVAKQFVGWRDYTCNEGLTLK